LGECGEGAQEPGIAESSESRPAGGLARRALCLTGGGRGGDGALRRGLDLLRERLPPRLELEHERLRRLARETELAARQVVGVAVARRGEAGLDAQELVRLDDPHLLAERSLEHDREPAEPFLPRLLEQAE